MTLRAMPVRTDRWQPDDRIYEGVLRRCAADADSAESPDGTAEYMAVGLILAVLAVVILFVSDSPSTAILICGLLGVAFFGYMVTRNKAPQGDRREALRGIGGAGRLPAGFLVHPLAWKAGMAEHVRGLPESQLRAAADMCHLYPGTVDDLLIFVGNLAIHVPPKPNATPDDVAKRARALVRAGLPLIAQHIKTTPALPRPAAAKKK
ncbi:MAG: hypothetical protein ABW022_00615 [Actinoplanes sp.]